jgi:hypothetical protein
MTPSPRRALAAALLGVTGVFAAVFAPVRATNFSGYDEWLYVHMASRGIVGWPYANRPLVWLWNLAPAHLVPNSLGAYYGAYCMYLLGTAFAVYALGRRLGGGSRALAFLAGVFAGVWAPMDHSRLNTVGLIGYAGFTMGTFLAALLLVEAHVRGRVALLAAAAVLGLVMPLGTEAVVPMLALFGVLPFWLRPRPPWRRWWTAAWAGVVLLGLLHALRPFARGGPQPSYQSSLGMDPHPWRVARRLAGQFAYHLRPLATTPLSELAVPAVPIAAAVFALSFSLLGPEQDIAPAGQRWRLWRLLALGALMAAAAYAPFVLTTKIEGAERTQILSTPGIALLLAGAAGLLGTVSPPRLRRWVVGVAGAWVVAVAAARTTALQREWDVWGSFPAQNSALVQLTDVAPDLKPNTMVVLLDERRAFPASFTFRHAVDHLYQGRALGLVWGASEYLYPCRFTPADIECEPWDMIRKEWRVQATRHRYDEVVVVRFGRDGTLALLDEWPSGLPVAPPPAYRPRDRILRGGPDPPERGILRRAG